MKRNCVWVIEWKNQSRRFAPFDSTVYESLARELLSMHAEANPKHKFRLRKYESTGE